MRPQFYSAFTLFFILLGCSRSAYVSEDFPAQSHDHMTIAVLPFEVRYTGRPEKNLTPQDIADQQAYEAEAFQQNLIDLIGQRAAPRSRKLTVELLSAQETVARLLDAGVDPLKTSDVRASVLTANLGVDAVLMATVAKDKSLTTAESLAATLVTGALNNPVLNGVNAALNRTYRVTARVTAVDRDGVVLYNDVHAINLNYATPVDEGVTIVNRAIIRKLPYIQ